MGRRRKEDETKTIFCNGAVAPTLNKNEDTLTKMSVEARNQHMSYGQLQAKNYASRTDFSVKAVLGDELKTIKERLREKEEAEKSTKKTKKKKDNKGAS